RLCHQANGALGSMIGRQVRSAHDAINGGQIDDASPPGLPHVWNGMLDAEKHAFHVYSHHFVPFGFGQLMGWFIGSGDARIVDEHIKLAEVVYDLSKDVPNPTFVRGIEMPITRDAIVCRDDVHGIAAVQNVEHCNARTFTGHAYRGAISDTQRAACYGSDFAV